MTAKTVAITGASSFTALWMAEAFHKSGWKVHALCPRSKDSYDGIKRKRLQLLKNFAEIHFNIRAEDDGMYSWIMKHKDANPVNIWIHHHHFMDEFRSENYDFKKALEVGLKPLPDIVQALKKSECQGIIFSGSYFEAGEGGQDIHARVLPYAQSKTYVWNDLEKLCDVADLKISKMVIPNPVGPLENEDRVIPTLIKNSKSKTPFVLRTPDSVADQIPVRVLSRCYVEMANDLLKGKEQFMRPSGTALTNKEWLDIVQTEFISKAMKLSPCELQIQDSTDAPKSYFNPPEEEQEFVWSAEWNHYADVLKTLE